MTVNSVECEYTRVINKGECVYERTYNSSATFYPNPIYSGECRNAIAYQFVPVVILSNAFQAFLLPILYFYYSAEVTDLNKEYRCMGFMFAGRTLILPMLSYLLVVIWSNVLLLLTYGLVSPVAFFALYLSIIMELYLLRFAICRYFHLEYKNGPDDMTSQVDEEVGIEKICENAQKTLGLTIWVGLLITTIIFTLFVVDMSLDAEYQPNDAACIIIVVILVLNVPISTKILDRNKSLMLSRLDERLFQVSRDNSLASQGVEMNSLGLDSFNSNHTSGTLADASDFNQRNGTLTNEASTTADSGVSVTNPMQVND